MNAITTHVLDTSQGQPAGGVPVTLEVQSAEGDWTLLGKDVTDADGRVRDLLPPGHVLSEGVYRLTFDTGTYFAAQAVQSFYLSVVIDFTVRDAGQHYHVPLLLSPYGYSTYRGS
ncbi:MAG TPA: hydroxyisourate hydrolase [Pyrinomonadaceae bacterium]|jgi:5-hydroxyisourate hydrolase